MSSWRMCYDMRQAADGRRKEGNGNCGPSDLMSIEW